MSGDFFFMEPPEDTGNDCAKKSAEQQQIAEKGNTEKACTDGADEKKWTGIIGKNKDMLGFWQGNKSFFVKLRRDFCTHGIARKNA